jgi:hypothetical protein
MYLIGRDQEAEPPFVAAISDEGEVGAARQRALERGDRDRADVVLAHRRHRLGLEHAHPVSRLWIASLRSQ